MTILSILRMSSRPVKADHADFRACSGPRRAQRRGLGTGLLSSSSASGLGGGTVWSTTRPSRRKTTRSAHEASWASWVTTTAATPLLAGGEDHPHHRLAVRRVERARRLVGEEEATLPHDGPGDRDPLALTTGELVGIVRRPIREAELFERGHARDAAPSSPDRPSSSRGSATFSTAVSPARRLKSWKT